MIQPRFVTRFSILLAATTHLSGCDGDGAGAPGDGRPALDGPDVTLEWTAEPVHSIGGLDAPDWATFGSVSRVAFDAEGYLYVFDGLAGLVTLVSPEGEYVRTIGRRGEGPGEVWQGFGMTVFPDGRVAITDFGHRALVVYDREGTWIGNAPQDLTGVGMPDREAVAHPSGRVLAGGGIRIGSGPSDGDESEPTGLPVWLHPTAEGDSAVLAYRAWEPPPPPAGGDATLEGSGGSGRIMLQMPRLRAFNPELHVAALPDGRIAVVDSTTYEITLVDPLSGAEDHGRLSRPLSPTPVDRGVENAERERRLAELRGEEGGSFVLLGGGGGGSVDAEAMRRMQEDRIAEMVFYPEIPVIEAMAADPMGRIWVQRSAGVPGVAGPTDVITVDGAYVGTLPPDGLRIPDAFGPGGLAAIVTEDEFDVATIEVVRYPIGG